jgi:uncharacterized protein (DUF983 family)
VSGDTLLSEDAMPEPVGPYDSLDPPPSSRPDGADSPGVTKALLRGLAKRCPRCGAKGIFVGWFQLRDRCPRCSLRFQREEGGFLGAMTINYAVAMAVWVPVLIVGFAVTSPNPPVLKLTLISAAIMVVIPLLFYPNSKSIWAAVEFLVSETEPLEPDPREPFPSEEDDPGGSFP